jgi:hypothetical protein
MTTGSDVLKATTRARIRYGGGASLARDLHVGLAALEEFATGAGKLTDATMDKLANELFPGASYDAQSDLLVPRRNEATTAFTVRAPSIPEMNLKLPVARPGPPPRLPQGTVSTTPRLSRPGWREG